MWEYNHTFKRKFGQEASLKTIIIYIKYYYTYRDIPVLRLMRKKLKNFHTVYRYIDRLHFKMTFRSLDRFTTRIINFFTFKCFPF